MPHTIAGHRAHRGLSAAVCFALAVLVPAPLLAQAPMLPGFDAAMLPPEDEVSSGLVDIGFSVNFFGVNVSQLYVNNNGSVTFDSPLIDFDPVTLNETSRRIIAPFSADVDTRTDGGTVTYGPGTVNGRSAFGVTWTNVDFYSSGTGSHAPRNTFQLVIINRSDTGAGNFDFWFNYLQVQWEAGEAHGGDPVTGLGGLTARVGYANGTGVSYEQAGSGIPGGLLDTNVTTGLVRTRLNSDINGRFVFEVRSGAVIPPTAAFTRYLAEGATGTFFDTQIALYNPNPADSATLRFLRNDGQVFPLTVALPANGRRTVNPETIPGLENADFSVVIESNQPVIVDRTMTWDATGFGSHAETSLATPLTTWYLAEGSTSGDFALFYLFQNPNATPVTVDIQFLLPAGQAPIVRQYTLLANSRLTIPIDEIPELASTDLSAVVTSTAPIIVERAMYLTRGGQPFAAGHESAAVGAPATAWFLAEGATGPFFDLFILMANPSAQDAMVEARYLTGTGAVFTKTYTLPGNSRTTVWVDDEIFGASGRALANEAVSTTLTVTTGPPIIVERAMWWPGPETTAAYWTEAHNSAGATATGTLWALAEGEVGGPAALETYILVANTSAVAATIRVTLNFEDGTPPVARDFTVGPNTRFNVAVSQDFPTAAGKRFGSLIESLGPSPAQIVVERAMYGSPGGSTWAAGTNALATRVRQ